jgi:uncharacterized protein
MTEKQAYRSSTAVQVYEPFSNDGATAGEVAWLRKSGSEGSTLRAGMWRCEKMTFPYPFLVDETFVMTEGLLRVELEDGTSWDLGRGDTASFLKGTKSTWTVLEPVLHFFIQTDKAAA